MVSSIINKYKEQGVELTQKYLKPEEPINIGPITAETTEVPEDSNKTSMSQNQTT